MFIYFNSNDKIDYRWSKEGIAKAVINILKENSPLFESMTKQLQADGKTIVEAVV